MTSLEDNYGRIIVVTCTTYTVNAVAVPWVHLQSHTNVFVKGLQRCYVEALQHGNVHLADNVVDNFCW